MHNFNILLGVCGKGLQQCTNYDDVKVLMFINVKKKQ